MDNDSKSLVKTIAIIILSLIAVTFIGLFVWMYIQYDDVRTDVDGQINLAVAKAVDEKAAELEDEFAEREKYPYKTFSGPEDYGELGFEYPKTWSAFISSDAAKGGDFEAYLNPSEVNPLSNETVNALRVTIRNKSYESVAAEYEKEVSKKNATLRAEAIEVNGASAVRYTGTIPKTELNGYIVIFKIRDKTAILRTDSVLFKNEFDKLLTTVTFNS